jgi:uncharacterized protein YcbK (DUF882 family)
MAGFAKTIQINRPVTREALEKRMDELAREYVQTRDKKIDKKIIDELYELARELEKLEKE